MQWACQVDVSLKQPLRVIDDCDAMTSIRSVRTKGTSSFVNGTLLGSRYPLCAALYRSQMRKRVTGADGADQETVIDEFVVCATIGPKRSEGLLVDTDIVVLEYESEPR
jgi:hypothetical protein